MSSSITLQEFFDKWQNPDLKLGERQASQSHFNDLCALLDVKPPVEADPAGEWFSFEKGVIKTGNSKKGMNKGWADIWRKGCFGWEYKGPGGNLDKAYHQLLRYSIALENPPLLIVSDMSAIRIHTNWTNTVQDTRDIQLTELKNARIRDILRDYFLAPEKLKPKKTRESLTEDAAQDFITLAQNLRQRGHEAHSVAYFINRLLFCMFAEDVRLLPDQMFKRMLESSQNKPDKFAHNAELLFSAMKSGGQVGFESVEWFNGGLFDDTNVLPLTEKDLKILLKVSRLDWSEIDASIIGTLFERGLDPDKRSQLGAHYTDTTKIQQIVQPVLVEPLEREWEDAKEKIKAALKNKKTNIPRKAMEAHTNFLERLRNFRVLDPACGSGNFLNLALTALKDIEHKANIEAEALGLQRATPQVGPENMLGIEINAYAAELARISVWIGEIQWMRRNGFDAGRNPVLRSLNTIENRDALLNDDGTPYQWPKADIIIGNPPFLGGGRMIPELGEDYTHVLRKAWKEVPAQSDLVCYWFWAAWEQMQNKNLMRAGLVATNSIRDGKSRTILDKITKTGRIFNAWSDEEWTIEGANVRVSLICFKKDTNKAPVILNGRSVAAINPDLTSSINITNAQQLSSNQGISFIGDQKTGAFDISEEEAHSLLLTFGNPNGRPNSDVLKPWQNGMDVVRYPSHRWIIDFGVSMSLKDAQLYEKPFALVEEKVRPTRLSNKIKDQRKQWWIHAGARPNMRTALADIKRYIAVPRIAKHRIFVWLDSRVLPDCQLVVFSRDDDTIFGILHSRFHRVWSLAMGSSLEDRPRYTPTTSFQTFPFPPGLTPDLTPARQAGNPFAAEIGEAARILDEQRETWLNPPNLTRRIPEVVPGFPDRILPVDETAAAELKNRTLTKLYNDNPAWLRQAHQDLDHAVAKAYGWDDAETLTDQDILARLLKLNRKEALRQTKWANKTAQKSSIRKKGRKTAAS